MHLSTGIKKRLENLTHEYLKTCLLKAESEISMIQSIHEQIIFLGYCWNNALKEERKPYLTSMSSEFIHKTPEVSYDGILPGRTKIEFGDLLYLYTETDSRGCKKETALLLQAKVIGNSVDKHQLDLYTKWSRFWLINNPNCKFKVVSKPKPHEGAKFLMLSKSLGKVNNFALIVDPKVNLRTTDTGFEFSEGLVGLLDFSKGRELKGHWKIAVNDVRKYIINMKRKSSYSPRHRRMILFGQNNNFLNISKVNLDSNSKGFWFIHIKAKVPYEFEEKINED